MNQVPMDDDSRYVTDKAERKMPFWTVYRLAILYIYRRHNGQTDYEDFNGYLDWANKNPAKCLLGSDGKIRVS